VYGIERNAGVGRGVSGKIDVDRKEAVRDYDLEGIVIGRTQCIAIKIYNDSHFAAWHQCIYKRRDDLPDNEVTIRIKPLDIRDKHFYARIVDKLYSVRGILAGVCRNNYIVLPGRIEINLFCIAGILRHVT